MTRLVLTNYVQGNATLIENDFIDKYMPAANGEYVKVYLLLLRYKGDPRQELSISHIADTLDCTEKDVVRALNHWQKVGLLDYEAKDEIYGAGTKAGNNTAKNGAGQAGTQKIDAELSGAPGAGSGQTSTAASENNVREEELKEIFLVVEKYLGKTLTKTEADAILFFYDDMKMSADLIEYLVEYCVEFGSKRIQYIRKVARGWAERGITTVEEAKESVKDFDNRYNTVRKAFGIKGRSLVPSETEFVERWYGEYGFTPEMVGEACNRTMKATHNPSFGYAESILSNWKKSGVKTLDDVKELDAQHKQNKKSTKNGKATEKKTQTPGNKFNNFTGRNYANIDELERRLIEGGEETSA